MKKVIVSCLVFPILLSVSCSMNSEFLTPVEGEKLVVRASVGDNGATRTEVQSDGTSVYWSADDEINLFYGAGKAGKFTATSIDGASAEFTGALSDVEGASVEGAGSPLFWGVYPYSSSNSCDGSGVTMTIPSAQDAKEGSFADKLNPVVASGSGVELTFYNVGAWFIFSVTQEGITSATLCGNGNEDLVGEIKVTMGTDGRPDAQVLNGEQSVTMEAPTGGFVPGEQYYMVVLPQTLSGGYTLYLTKGDLTAKCVVSKSAEFKRSEYRRKKDADSGVFFDGEIIFADDAVKALCVSNWDSDGDGKFFLSEAAAVTSLGTVFKGNTSITSFDEFQFFTSVTSVPSRTFFNCSSLTSITVPANVSDFKAGALEGCNSLSSIKVSEDNPTYDSRGGCNAVIRTSDNTIVAGCVSTVIPDSVTSIGDEAFSGLTNLSSFSIPGSVKSIGFASFSSCKNMTDVTISEGVESIGEYAFGQCKNLSEITIPSTVKSIGPEAFSTCSSLGSVYTLATNPPEGGENMFLNIMFFKIYVPGESVEAYKSADYWKDYKDQIVAIP